MNRNAYSYTSHHLSPVSPPPQKQPIRPHPLTPKEVQESRSTHGSNQLKTRKKKSFLSQFLGNFNDPVIRILLIALVLNVIFSFHGGTDWVETLGIAMAVFLATLISTLSEYGSEAAFARLKEACEQTVCRVERLADALDEVMICEVDMDDLVVGDWVHLQAGETIPADGVLLSGKVTVNQAAMTGESKDIQKTPLVGDIPSSLSPNQPHSLCRGCMVLEGHGVMMVTAVGDATFLGQISEEVQTDTRESPLKIRLAKLAKQISSLGYVAAVLVAVIHLINAILFENAFQLPLILEKLQDFSYVFETLFSALTLGLTVLVVAVPEGLPMMIAVVLSSNIKKMVRDQVLVRKPVGIESAGSMNILFTDKTGTLTEGKLSVGGIYLGDGTLMPNLSACQKHASVVASRLIQTAHTNTLASVGYTDAHPHRLQALGGNATDRALLEFVLPCSSHQKNAYGKVIDMMPFDSTVKCSCAWVEKEGKMSLFVKGAPERLLPMVTHMYSSRGQLVGADTLAIRRTWETLTADGQRVLMIAENTSPHLPTQAQVTLGHMGDLTLICLVVLRDRLRPEAPKAVATLRRAGIHVVMMTGDNKDTATAIARGCGILGSKQRGDFPHVIESAQLSQMTDAQIKEILPRLFVVARALPTDKSRLVRLAQEMDLVVGMTGDGINDAPALKRADVGFAMGDGTQVAKDAGDIIIMDNRLSSIVKAVLYGRTIFKSIRKFITLQLTMNLCAMGVTMICPFLGVDAPVTVVQMLWINLIMDTLGGLAFAGEAPLPSYMDERPKRRDEPILNGYMIHQICFLGGFTVALCLFFLKCPLITGQFRWASDDIYLLTAFFALFIFSSVFNCFNARTDRLKCLSGLSKNKAFCLVMSGVLLIQVWFVYLGGQVLRTAPLTLRELGLTALLACLVFPADLIRKVFWRLGGKGQGF